MIATALEIPFVDVIAGIGIVVGAVLGAWYAPAAATTDAPLGLVFRMSILAMPLGGAIFGAVFAGGTAPALVLLTTAFAVVLYPLFAPVIVPIALAAVMAGRRLLALPVRTAALLLAALLAADLAGWIVAPATADRLSPIVIGASGDLLRTGPHWFVGLTAARRVEVTIVNESPASTLLELTWPIGGGFESGEEAVAPGCFVMAVTMTAEDGWELKARNAAIADGDDFNGDAAIVLTIDPEGAMRSVPGRFDDAALGPIPGCVPSR